MPTIVGAIRLPERLRWADAMELLLTGAPMTAERAKEVGLVWKLVEPDELQAQARCMGADADEGSAPGAARHQGGRVAHREHGVDRVRPLRRDDAQSRRRDRRCGRGNPGVAGEAEATVAGTLTMGRGHQ